MHFLYSCALLSYVLGQEFTDLKKIGLYVFTAALVLGINIQHIDLIGIANIGCLAIIMYLLRFSSISVIYKGLLHLAVCLFFLGFSMHLLPGFHNWKILDSIRLSAHAIPYTMYLNVEKPVYIFLFMYFYKQTAITHYNWAKIFKWTSISLLFSIILLLLNNHIYRLVEWDPKVPSASLASIWIVRMLLDTALGEEVFFRGYLQKNFTYLFHSFKFAPWISCVLVSLLFGSMHLPAGIPMGIMATLAGIGYGTAYVKTSTIEASTLTHFGMNVLHFLLFSYPMLAQQI